MKKIIVVLLIILFVIIVLVSIICSLIISSNVPSSGFNITTESIAAMNSLQKKYKEESYYIYTPDVGYKLRKVALSKVELNTMFAMAIAGSQVSGAMTDADNYVTLSKAEFDNGIFKFDFYFDLPFRTPFGSYIVLSLKIIPVLDNDSIKVKFISFYVGDISIPISAVDYFMKKAEGNINNNPISKQLMKSIKKLTIRKNGIEIYYYPKEVGKLLNHF
jgi:hypothetical protein